MKLPLTTDKLFVTLAVRVFGPDPDALAKLTADDPDIPPDEVELHFKAAGQSFKLRILPSADHGLLTFDIRHLLIDKIPAPASAAERLVAHFAGLTYAGGLLALALPWPVIAAGVQGGQLNIILEGQ